MKDSRELSDLLAQRYSGFLGDVRGGDLVVDLSLSRQSGSPDAKQIEVNCADGAVYAVRSDFDGCIDLDTSEGQLRIFPTDYSDVSADAFLRLAVSVWALKNDALLLHGAGVLVNGAGVVCIGKSGAGKSTIARLAAQKNLRVLSDEISIVWKNRNGWMVAGTPFSGELEQAKSSERALLKAVYLIRKSLAMRVANPRRGSELRQLSRSILVFGGLGVVYAGLLKSALSLIDEVGLKVLHFRPEPEVWNLVDADI